MIPRDRANIELAKLLILVAEQSGVPVDADVRALAEAEPESKVVRVDAGDVAAARLKIELLLEDGMSVSESLWRIAGAAPGGRVRS